MCTLCMNMRLQLYVYLNFPVILDHMKFHNRPFHLCINLFLYAQKFFWMLNVSGFIKWKWYYIFFFVHSLSLWRLFVFRCKITPGILTSFFLSVLLIWNEKACGMWHEPFGYNIQIHTLTLMLIYLQRYYLQYIWEKIGVYDSSVFKLAYWNTSLIEW